MATTRSRSRIAHLPSSRALCVPESLPLSLAGGGRVNAPADPLAFDRPRQANRDARTLAVELREKLGPRLHEILKEQPNPNKEWVALQEELAKQGNWVAENAAFVADLKRVYWAQRDPEQVLDPIVEIWQRAAVNRTTTREALESMFPGGPNHVYDIPLGGDLTRDVLLRKGPFRDLVFADDVHGAHTHMFPELLTARVLGSVDAASRFRQRIGESSGFTVDKKSLWRSIWNAVFDTTDGGHINTPETLGKILQEDLGLPRWGGTLPAKR
jgi:hypothetical protein